jgi:hypothetical protein
VTFREGLKAYFTGWFNFLGSIVYVSLWWIIVGLPIILLRLFLPDFMEGNGEGSALGDALAVVVVLTWVPWISYKLGMLAFETDVRPAKPRRPDPEIELLRGILATQERLAAARRQPEEENESAQEGS